MFKPNYSTTTQWTYMQTLIFMRINEIERKSEEN